MRLVRADTIGDVSHYKLVTADRPEPAAGQLLIKVMAVGMGYVDALVATGGYQVKPEAPFTPGQEFSGIVEAVGDGVTAFKTGDRVLAGSFGGALAEYAAIDQASALVIPPAMSFHQAAAFRTNYLTAFHALKDRARLAAGENLLILGAGGGVGIAAVQIGRMLGANVVAAASSDAKRAFALDNGAQVAIGTEEEGWRDRVKEAFGGRGPDVVLDPVTGALFEPSFRSLAWNGRYLVVGFAGSGGQIAKLAVNLPLLKGSALVGVDVRQFALYEKDLAASHLAHLLACVGDGRLTPPEGRSFPFESFAEAMTFALSGQAVGKPVILVGRDDGAPARAG